MAFSVKIIKDAEVDLRNAVEYIAYALCNPKAARDLNKEFISTIDTLCMFPYSRAKMSFSAKYPELYKTHVKNYIVFYTVSEEDSLITVVRILHGGMDWEKLL